MRRDCVGIIASFWLALFIIVVYVVVSSASEHREQERDRYFSCVRNIPKYLDAQEILYMEQECR